MNSKVRNIIIAIVGLAVIAVLIAIFAKSSNKETSLIRTGQIEMREYDVASKIPGRIEWIKADEGDSVVIGQELFKLTDKEVRAKYGQAMGAVESAEAQYAMANKGARQEQIDMAQRSYLAAKSQADLAQVTLERMKKLHAEKLISDQELDVATQKYKGATEQTEAAFAQYNMAKNGTRSEEKTMAKGQLNRAKSGAEEAKAYVDESIICAPIGGIIAKRYSDANELVAVGYPVLTIIDPNDSWCELNITATELEKIKIGSVLTGFIHGLGRSEQFKVTSFAAMADFANWRAQNEKGTFDVRTFTVKLKPVNYINGMRPGMTVSFDLNKQN